jgi:hypothetical protein
MLDLDDFGAEIAEHHGAPRSGKHAGQIQNANAGEREGTIQVRHGKSGVKKG